MLFLAGDDAGPSDPLTADLTPVFQVLGIVGGIAVVIAIAVVAARFVARRRGQHIPKAITLTAVIAGAIGFILVVMAVGAGVVVA